MPVLFEPLLKHGGFSGAFEPFANQSETVSIVSGTFIGAGLMVIATVITWLFIWSYQKNVHLFVTMFALVAFIFGVEIVILTAINMSELEKTQFRMFMSSSILFSLICVVIALFGFFKYKQQSASSSYVPSSVQSYLN
jgi:uncharacterized YccA/Bax inhibitor family protein